MLSKTFIVLATAALAIAAPATRQVDNSATCAYHMTPSAEVPELDTTSEVNYTIGLGIVQSIASGSIVNYGFDAVLNADGSYTNTGKVEAVGLTAEELKALVTSWPGKQLDGLPQFGIIWTVNEVTCE